MVTVLPNENTYWHKAKKMLDEGKSPDEVILYLAAIIDMLISMNELECPFKH
jgi:hypothetical protein